MRTKGKFILNDDHSISEVDDLIVWGKWMETDKRIVKQETVNGLWVSTVFLGLDHGFGMYRDVGPILFETMIFKVHPDRRKEDVGYQERCSTYSQALIQHREAIKWAENYGKSNNSTNSSTGE